MAQIEFLRGTFLADRYYAQGEVLDLPQRDAEPFVAHRYAKFVAKFVVEAPAETPPVLELEPESTDAPIKKVARKKVESTGIPDC